MVEATKQVKEETPKKARHRSPSYPAVGLRDAVSRVKNLYQKDGKAGAPPKLAAVHIGFQTPHGQAMAVLSALKKFGLVDMVKGRLAPTQRAIEILNLPEDDSRRIQALKDAALAPPIYRELVDQHKASGFPADDVLGSELAAYKNFNPNAVAGFVKDFKDTLDFAGLSGSDELNIQAMRHATGAQQEEADIEPMSSPDAFGGGSTARKSLDAVVRRYPMDISIPRNLKAELSIAGGDLRRDDLERLKKQLDRLIDNLADAFED